MVQDDCLPYNLVKKAFKNIGKINFGLYRVVRAVRNVSACMQRSRGASLIPRPVPSFRGDWSWNNFYSHNLLLLLIQEGFLPSSLLCYQLQGKVCAQSTGKPLAKSMVRWADRPDMTIAVDWDVKQNFGFGICSIEDVYFNLFKWLSQVDLDLLNVKVWPWPT